MGSALRARMLRWLNGPTLVSLLAGCQADPAPLAQTEAMAKRPPVIQLAGAEEAAAETPSAPRRSRVQLEHGLMSQSASTDAPPESPAETNRAAVLLDPPSVPPPTPSPSARPEPAPDDVSVDAEGASATVDAYLEVARMAHQRGLPAVAEKYYFKAVHAYPDSALAWNDLGQFYKAQQKYAQGVHATQMAVRLEPQSRRYHNNLGELLVRNGHVDEGIREFTLAVGRAAAHYNAGVVLAELGQRAKSVQQMRLALAANPKLRPAQAALEQLAPNTVPARRGSGKPAAASQGKDVNRPSEGPLLEAAQRPGAGGHAQQTSRRDAPKSLTQRIGDFFRRPAAALRASDRRSAARYRSQEQPRRGLFSASRDDRTATAPQSTSQRTSVVDGDNGK